MCFRECVRLSFGRWSFGNIYIHMCVFMYTTHTFCFWVRVSSVLARGCARALIDWLAAVWAMGFAAVARRAALAGTASQACQPNRAMMKLTIKFI